ncbi:MAG: DUF6249 domain-containing protein [Anaerolineales bacterium]
MTLTFWFVFVLPLVLVTVILGFITLHRYIRYKERVALAQLGYAPDEASPNARGGNRGVLWGGVITAASGLALLLGLGTLGMGAWLIAGLLPLCVGLGMVLIYYLTSGTTHEGRATPPEPFASDPELEAERAEQTSAADGPAAR